jgi:ABC-type branched-subunit amino acid transport system ATPase component
VLKRPELAPLTEGVPALEVVDLSVRFGGNVAVDGVSLHVGSDEIVGLIGTNGAGKSTLMNGIGGFVNASGTVRLGGVDVSHHGASYRARKGLGRTFQAARLFPELTVRETVQVACEARGRTAFLATALFLPHAAKQERQHRSDADDPIGFLGLGRYANVRVADLSTGTRRIVELAGLLALDARVLCLDEPTAGVAQRETEAFGPLIKEIRRELGASMLVIEHDMPLIMGISDRVYCLEVGTVIAEGPPGVVRDDQKVIASYLGVDERAIERSGTVSSRRQPEGVEHS